MKILVISRLKSTGSISVITHRQMLSVQKLGHELSYFGVEKGGLFGYFQAMNKLRSLLQKEKYDVVHAHYSLCGIIASLAGSNSLVVSLMGSDVKKSVFNGLVINLFIKFKWSKLLVKSEEMFNQISPSITSDKSIEIIPNGVDFEVFKPIEKSVARKNLGWDANKKIVLFGSDPARTEKRFHLAKKAVDNLRNQPFELELIALKDVLSEEVPFYLCGCDILLLTSEREGSPNIIKEAMASNCPIVTTNVGDVVKVIGNTEGCIVVPNDSHQSISTALLEIFNSRIERTDGRNNIDWLEQETIASKLVRFYEK